MEKKIIKNVMVIVILIALFDITSNCYAEPYQGNDCPPNDVVIKNSRQSQSSVIGKTMDSDGRYMFYLQSPNDPKRISKFPVIKLDTGTWVIEILGEPFIIQK